MLDHRVSIERYPAPKWCEILGLAFRTSGDLDRLCEATRTGRPFGGKDFIAELEAKLERDLEPQKRSRKPKPVLQNLMKDNLILYYIECAGE